MAEASEIVTRAFRRLQAIDINEQPSAAEMTHGLAVMSEMVNGWGRQGIVTATQTITGNVTDDNDVVSGILPDTGNLLRGHNISGTGIAANTTIKDVLSDKSIRLSTDGTISGSAVSLTIAFLPVPASHEGAMVALLAVRLSEDLGLPVSARLDSDAREGWSDLLAAYMPDRKAKFDRALALPAGTWDIEQDLVS